MAPTLVRRRWTPPVTARVNSSHPCAAGMFVCHVPMGKDMRALVGGLDLVGTSTDRGVGEFGDGVLLNASGSKIEATATAEMKPTKQVSVMAVYHRYAATSATVGLYGTTNNNTAASPQVGVMLFDLTSNNIRFDFNNGTTQILLTGTGQNTLGGHVVIGTVLTGVQELYVDGIRANAGTDGFTDIAYTATSLIASGDYTGLTARTPNFVLHMGAMWDRVLSASEIAMLSDNPFCFIKR